MTTTPSSIQIFNTFFVCSLLQEQLTAFSLDDDVQHKFYALHLEMLREYLALEFSALREKITFDYDMYRVADDWVLMCFLIGNDFLPHLPQFSIATDGLTLLYKAYLKVLPTVDGEFYFIYYH